MFQISKRKKKYEINRIFNCGYCSIDQEKIKAPEQPTCFSKKNPMTID
jgi:hypothetical protein